MLEFGSNSVPVPAQIRTNFGPMGHAPSAMLLPLRCSSLFFSSLFFAPFLGTVFLSIFGALGGPKIDEKSIKIDVGTYFFGDLNFSSIIRRFFL